MNIRINLVCSTPITDEDPKIPIKTHKLIRERIVTSRSKLSNQHQGHDAILEEINKTLKF